MNGCTLRRTEGKAEEWGKVLICIMYRYKLPTMNVIIMYVQTILIKLVLEWINGSSHYETIAVWTTDLFASWKAHTHTHPPSGFVKDIQPEYDQTSRCNCQFLENIAEIETY